MQLKKLTIEDRELFLKIQPENEIHTQYMSFTNLFLWKDCENIEYFCYEDFPVVTGLDFEQKRYFMLPEKLFVSDELICFIKTNFKDAHRIVALASEQKDNIDENILEKYEIIHDRNMDNYIYLSQNLATLSGKKLHSKRNHINNFKKSYNYEFCLLSDENINEVMEFLEEWYKKRIPDDETLLYEMTAVFNGLKFRKELGMKGAFIRTDGKIIAFTMGDKMTSDMAVIHFEKADTDYKGSYAVINMEFVKNCWKDVTYINREDDMGLEGLRKSKLSYYPFMLKESYTLMLEEK